jgi:hypothetical protein
MYLGDSQLNSLACYIRGMILGLQVAGVRNTREEAFLKKFGEWLGKRIDSHNGDCWFYLLQCYPERIGHVDDFYHYLDIFIIEMGLNHGLKDEELDSILLNME